MGKTLYRSYRSTSFDEIIGQDHIVTTLKNALKKGEISHAYLFCGPRGTGKTSIARILAHAVNDFTYSGEGSQLDIIEIDAASNRRIDEIREIRDKVNIAPSIGKYKVYIIDEVHMLTREAFNALLKTLEEPPKHVIFILATTEFHKVPDTIASRCITFMFRAIPKDILVKHLTNVAKSEKIVIDSEALEMLASQSRGSFRDALSLLEQVKFFADKITASEVRNLLGLAPDEYVQGIITAASHADLKSVAQHIDEALASGASETVLSSQIAAKIRDMLMTNPANNQAYIEVLHELLFVPGAPNPRTALELCMFRLSMKNEPQQTQSLANTPPTTEKIKKTAVTAPALETATSQKAPEPIAPLPSENMLPTDENIEKKPDVTKAHGKTSNESSDIWPLALEQLKKTNNTLYAISRMAEASVHDDILLLSFGFKFHHKQASESKNQAIISETIRTIAGKDITLKLELKSAVAPQTNKPEKKSPDLTNVSNIFGGHEVLES